MNFIISLVAGIIFGAGLLISGMMDPAKIIGFLDLFGEWDPTLIFVMGSALAITVPAYHFILKKERPLFSEGFSLANTQALDKPLVFGSAIFGIGWGLYGYCPGPGISSLGSLNMAGFVFVPCMLVGMFIADKVEK